jgi:hypothetical protein
MPITSYWQKRAASYLWNKTPSYARLRQYFSVVGNANFIYAETITINIRFVYLSKSSFWTKLEVLLREQSFQEGIQNAGL